MRTPKLTPTPATTRYRYYAGYSAGFVEDALDNLAINANDLLLDPWNGAGTTTTIAEQRGQTALGIDANPVLVLVARGRLLGRGVAASLTPLAKDVLNHVDDMTSDWAEPLEAWFHPKTAAHLRQLELAIRRLLVEPSADATTELDVNQVSSLAALFYVALFDVVREELTGFVSSNPTWIKLPSKIERASVRQRDLHTAFFKSVQRLQAQQSKSGADHAGAATSVQLGTSLSLPLRDASVSAVLTSPPYCTRIDYVVATRPELAVLGLSAERVSELRRNMLGTPLTRGWKRISDEAWGSCASELLVKVAEHSSHASATYYYAYFAQYFDRLWQSLGELRRVLKAGGKSTVVVQDSYYKEFHIDLARIVREMSHNCGWSTTSQIDFPVLRTLAAINPGTKAYRSDFTAIETAVFLE